MMVDRGMMELTGPGVQRHPYDGSVSKMCITVAHTVEGEDYHYCELWVEVHRDKRCYGSANNLGMQFAASKGYSRSPYL